jgi:hypothetical protein
VNVTTLLNTELRPGRIVQIDSREFDEVNLRVQSVAHKGDSYQGVWQSVAELETIV